MKNLHITLYENFNSNKWLGKIHIATNNDVEVYTSSQCSNSDLTYKAVATDGIPGYPSVYSHNPNVVVDIDQFITTAQDAADLLRYLQNNCTVSHLIYNARIEYYIGVIIHDHKTGKYSRIYDSENFEEENELLVPIYGDKVFTPGNYKTPGTDENFNKNGVATVVMTRTEYPIKFDGTAPEFTYKVQGKYKLNFEFIDEVGQPIRLKVNFNETSVTQSAMPGYVWSNSTYSWLQFGDNHAGLCLFPAGTYDTATWKPDQVTFVNNNTSIINSKDYFYNMRKHIEFDLPQPETVSFIDMYKDHKVDEFIANLSQTYDNTISGLDQRIDELDETVQGIKLDTTNGYYTAV